MLVIKKNTVVSRDFVGTQSTNDDHAVVISTFKDDKSFDCTFTLTDGHTNEISLGVYVYKHRAQGEEIDQDTVNDMESSIVTALKIIGKLNEYIGIVQNELDELQAK